MKRFLLIYIFTGVLFTLTGAEQPGNIPTRNNGIAAFNEGRYSDAARIFSSLLEHANNDPVLNYYQGVSLYKINKHRSEAIQRLRLAARRPPFPEVHLYLGKLYQRGFELDLAINHYKQFLELASANNPSRAIAQRGIEDCIASKDLINKHFNITITGKDTIHADQILGYYHLTKEAGRLKRAGDFFSVGINPGQVIFRTERGNEVYFPVLGSNNTHDLFRMVRLLDSWSDAELMASPLNSPHNELYPFQMADGVTFYFASDRPGGMGGLDIYQTLFDPETGTYSPPSNLGPPFNSANDDFLLVPDTNSGKAWFSTNRGVSPDSVVVVEIIWDNSVIKNLTNDINQLLKISALPLAPGASPNRNRAANRQNQSLPNGEPGNLRFAITDTLVYTSIDNFLCNQARNTFIQAQEMEARRDVLSREINSLRVAYTQTYDRQELSRLINLIPVREQELFRVEAELRNLQLTTRRLELQKLNQLTNEGRPTQRQPVVNNTGNRKSANQLALGDLSNSGFIFSPDHEFERNQERLHRLYVHFFEANQINELKRADSIFAWANILSLESARALERAHSLPPHVPTMRERLANQNAATIENPEAATLINQSRVLRERSLSLYEMALDNKFSLYHPEAMEFASTTSRVGTEDMIHQASSKFRQAEEGLNSIVVPNPEARERLLALKRQAVNMLEKSLEIQAAGVSDTPNSHPGMPGRFIQSTNQPQRAALPLSRPPATTYNQQQNIENIPARAPAEMVSQAFAPQPGTVEYRIQIGAFRNQPNAQALSKIPPVTKMEMPGTGLNRYFSGSWQKFQDAQNQVQPIRDAGFPGAFVVAFLNGEQITLEQARQME